MNENIKETLTLLVGFVLLLLYARVWIKYYLKIRKIKKSGFEANGIIVNKEIDRYRTGYVPVVEFRFEDQVLKKEVVHSLFRLPFKEGKQVQVYYNNDIPDYCVIKSDSTLTLAIVLFIFFFTILSYIAIA